MTLFANRGRFAYATTMPRSEKEKMLAGELYRAVGPELAADNLRADRLLRAYNATGVDETERRSAILGDLGRSSRFGRRGRGGAPAVLLRLRL